MTYNVAFPQTVNILSRKLMKRLWFILHYAVSSQLWKLSNQSQCKSLCSACNEITHKFYTSLVCFCEDYITDFCTKITDIWPHLWSVIWKCNRSLVFETPYGFGCGVRETGTWMCNTRVQTISVQKKGKVNHVLGHYISPLTSFVKS